MSKQNGKQKRVADVEDDSSPNLWSLSSTFRSSLASEVSPKVRFTTGNRFSRVTGPPDRTFQFQNFFEIYRVTVISIFVDTCAKRGGKQIYF